MSENYTTDKVEWNLSSGLLQQIQFLLSSSITAYQNGNINKMFYDLKSIKMRIIQELKPNQRQELTSFENKVTYFLKIKNRRLSAYYTEKYNELIMDLLEEYGFLMKKKPNLGKAITN